MDNMSLTTTSIELLDEICPGSGLLSCTFADMQDSRPDSGHKIDSFPMKDKRQSKIARLTFKTTEIK